MISRMAGAVSARHLVLGIACTFVFAAETGRAQHAEQSLELRWQQEHPPEPANFTQDFCERLWAFDWQWAKRGSVGARAELGKAVFGSMINPPGLTQDLATRLKHSWTLLLHGSVNGDRVSLEFLKEMIGSTRLSQEDRAPFDNCLVAPDRRACVQHLVDQGLVADFDRYARELDLSAAAPGAFSVHCLATNTPPIP
jgi:hypothetical protein